MSKPRLGWCLIFGTAYGMLVYQVMPIVALIILLTTGETGMKIKEIISQHRRDFTAIYECEHCGHTKRGSGYDDQNFHENVVPAMHCEKCKNAASDTYRPLATKYPEGYQI